METKEKTEKEKAPSGWKKPLPRFDDLGPNVPSFEKYFEEHVGLIRMVQDMMSKALSDSPAEMDAQVRACERYFVNMKSVLAFADSYLDVAENRCLLEKSHGWSDLDRRVALDAAVTRERRFRDVVRGIVEGMQTRISYAQSRLRTFSEAEGQKWHP